MSFLSKLGSAFSAINPVAALANVGGSIADYFAQDQTNRMNMQMASDANRSAAEQAAQNMLMQKEFAQNGIQWRVQDAEKAGIAPLAALGASVTGYSPVVAAFNTPEYKSPFHSMGQNISRAIASSMSALDREKAALELQILRNNADLAETQAKSAKWKLLKDQSAPANPAVPDFQTFYDRRGHQYFMPSKEYAESSYGSHFGRTTWNWHDALSSLGLQQDAMHYPEKYVSPNEVRIDIP